MRKIWVLLWLIIFFNLSCFISHFRLRKDVDIKGKRLAVVAGLFNQTTKKYANLLTGELKKVSKFSLISQRSIQRANGRYPVKVKGPYSTAYFQIENDYSLSDKEKLMKYAKSVRADYIYAIWVPIEGIYDGNMYKMEAIGQMFDVKKGEEIGYGKYPIWWITGSYIGYGAPKNKKEALIRSSEFVAKEMARLTKMTR